MAKIPLSAEQKCLHKKLLPSNIVMCIVALLAAVAMILLPWFDLRVRIQGDKVADLLPEQQSGEQASDEMTDSLLEALQGNEIDIVVNIHPIKMAMAVIGGDKEMESFMDSLIGKEGAAVFAQDLATMIIPAFIEGVVHSTIDSLVEEALQAAGKDSTPELQAQVETYKEEATAAVEILVGKATTPSNPTEAKTRFNNLVDDMAAEQLADHDITLDAAALKDAFAEIIELGTNEDGEFDVIHLLGNLEQLAEGEEGDSQMQDVQAILDIIENPSAVLMEKLGNNKSTVKLVVLALFVLFVAIPVFFWLHLAIASFVRIFTAKKTAVTWYAKFFGFWAGFGVVLLDVAILLLPLVQSWLNIAMLAPVVDALGAMTIYFHGSGTVTAVCWLIIVIIGWCGYKRTAKIWRRVKKCTKKADKMGLDVQTYFEQEDKKVRKKAEKKGLATSDYVQMRKDKLRIHVEETPKVAYWSELKSDEETSAPTTEYAEETPFAAENAATKAYAQAPAEMPEEEPTQEIAEEKDSLDGLEGTVYLPDDMKADAPVQDSAPVEEPVETPVVEETTPVAEEPAETPVVEESAPVEEKVEEKAEETPKKQAAKKPAAKKPAAKKTEEVKAEEKKATPKKAATAETKKPATKKSATATTEAKKPAAKKAAPQSTTTTKTTTKKTPNETTTTTTKTTKKATSNSTTTTKTTTKTTKTPTSTTTTKTTTTTTTPKKKSTSQKSSTTKRKSVPVVDEEMLNEIKD